ncbi:hypothetical protein PHLCEN_2v9869 [Hermanssonia centrifuga]|uniref:Uncharacterized protein n=1 Tax=Hermanssonia centrifuga TaxID=98765 RepID=A0A2R6NPF6_9APHY|nr:hypothetical protein PHLCEN_2v9869 [Hermanssonia centrifuga]
MLASDAKHDDEGNDIRNPNGALIPVQYEPKAKDFMNPTYIPMHNFVSAECDLDIESVLLEYLVQVLK